MEEIEGHHGQKRGWVPSWHGVILTELGHGGSRDPAKASLGCAKKWQPSLAFELVSRRDLAHISHSEWPHVRYRKPTSLSIS